MKVVDLVLGPGVEVNSHRKVMTLRFGALLARGLLAKVAIILLLNTTDQVSCLTVYVGHFGSYLAFLHVICSVVDGLVIYYLTTLFQYQALYSVE